MSMLRMPVLRLHYSPFDRQLVAASGLSSSEAMSRGCHASKEADWLRDVRGGFSSMPMYTGTAESGASLGLTPNEAVPRYETPSEDEDDDDESLDEEGNDQPAKKRLKCPSPSKRTAQGKSIGTEERKNAKESPASIRKAQNRLAQREFRQRKQQYIRALESRVELLSSSKDEQVARMSFLIQGLIAENNQLRQLVMSFSSFVGSQKLGGPLQKAGIAREELDKLIKNPSEKTMIENWQEYPGAKESETLQQIRKENDLPPEGLPESHKLPNQQQQIRRRSDTVKEQASRLQKSASPEKKRRASASKAATSSKISNSHSPTTKGQSSSSSNDQQSLMLLASSTPASSTLASSSSLNDFFSADNLVFSASEASTAMQVSSSTSSSNPFTSAPVHAFNTSAISGLTRLPDDLHSHQSSSGLLANFFSNNASGIMDQQDFQFHSSSIRHCMNDLQHLQRWMLQVQSEKGIDANRVDQVGRALRELFQRIIYWQDNSNYHLPSVLQPFESQETRPHDPLIDALPFPGLRARLIALQYAFSIEDVIKAILRFAQLRIDSKISDAETWELPFEFLAKYPLLIDEQTLADCNRKRVERGESILKQADLTLAN